MLVRKTGIKTHPDAQNPPAAVSKPNPVKSPRQARRSWIVIALRLGHRVKKVCRRLGTQPVGSMLSTLHKSCLLIMGFEDSAQPTS